MATDEQMRDIFNNLFVHIYKMGYDKGQEDFKQKVREAIESMWFPTGVSKDIERIMKTDLKIKLNL